VNYWIVKSEPTTYSIKDLQQERQTIWDGVRNYQASNFLRQMTKNDLAFFYHSNTKMPGIVGLIRVVASNAIDPTQFDPQSKYYDPKATRDRPRWYTVKVEYIETFPKLISLNQLKTEFDGDRLLVVRKGNRLSVMPVSEEVATKILTMARNC
jgi:predicted RNA-binding protein with PUA-like domain